MTNQQLVNTLNLVGKLKSGLYQQNIGQLKNNNSFCWAGVACDLYDCLNENNQNYLSQWWKEEYDNNRYVEESFAGERFVMPEEVRKFYGFVSPIGEFIGKPWDLESLSNMNDAGCDFNTIASTIKWGLDNQEYSEMFMK